ncbi:hypothetical protein BPOR_0918g00030 [Botrytis porri]|uniref:Uncharacterized protein n=1 Tax=Botrytis porri TaxID=87229 RepID=A0A4Z1K9M3_9HELO|nr:hypothetical protein BPOR_0918g00030 [Botrytis porri]
MDGFGDLADFDLMDGLDDMNEYDSDNMDVMGIRAKYNNIAGFDIMAESDLDEFEDKDDSDRMEPPPSTHKKVTGMDEINKLINDLEDAGTEAQEETNSLIVFFDTVDLREKSPRGDKVAELLQLTPKVCDITLKFLTFYIEGVTNGPPYGEALPPVTCAIRIVTFENLTGNYGFTSRIFAGCAHSLVGFEAWTLSVDEHFEPLDPLL